MAKENTYQKVMNLASRRSLFYPSSEIYNPPAGLWDYGPFGLSIKRKVVDLWRQHLVQKENMLEIDGSNIMPQEVFKASGHLDKFDDPFIQCKKCGTVYRPDNLISEKTGKDVGEGLADNEFDSLIQKEKIKCTKCGSVEFLPTRRFNMMLGVELGATGGSKAYLRPETCQSIFADFDRMNKTMRMKLPQGIAQVGRSYRNEINPRNGLLRAIEFNQMEIEMFFDPEEINKIENFAEIENYELMILRNKKDSIEKVKAKDLVTKKIVTGKLSAYYLSKLQQLYENYGIKKENMRFKEVSKEDRPFYSGETWDFEIKTDLGWIEVTANNYRTDYDLGKHSQVSGKKLEYTTAEGKKFIPHVWEISIGLDRTIYCILDNCYKEDVQSKRIGHMSRIKDSQQETKKDVNDQETTRVLLSLKPKIAPIQVAIFPLMKKEPLMEKAKEVYNLIYEEFAKNNSNFEIMFDYAGSIGKRYFRVDEIGCPYSITIDFDSLENNDVTIRERDSTEQKRVKMSDLKKVLKF